MKLTLKLLRHPHENSPNFVLSVLLLTRLGQQYQAWTTTFSQGPQQSRFTCREYRLWTTISIDQGLGFPFDNRKQDAARLPHVTNELSYSSKLRPSSPMLVQISIHHSLLLSSIAPRAS